MFLMDLSAFHVSVKGPRVIFKPSIDGSKEWFFLWLFMCAAVTVIDDKLTFDPRVDAAFVLFS